MSSSFRTTIFALFFIPYAIAIRCHVCSRLRGVIQKPCPGSELEDFPNAFACRFMSLSDGTILNQSPVAKNLCQESSFKYVKQKITQDFFDPYGQVLCCKWDGCNRDLRSANTTSKEYELRLMKEILGSETDAFSSNRRNDQLNVASKLLLNYLSKNQGSVQRRPSGSIQLQQHMQLHHDIPPLASTISKLTSILGHNDEAQLSISQISNQQTGMG